MKLATLKDSTRDGRLVVVSRDLTRCSEVGHIARTLQAALDDWAHAGPRLGEVADGLETGAQPSQRFHEREAHSPLPRAYQWADGSAYVNHVELVRKARNAEMPESFWTTSPLMYQGGSDAFLAPRAPTFRDGAIEAYGLRHGRQRSPSSPTTCRWASPANEAARIAIKPGHAGQRCLPARPHPS
jgi:fumarylacetoacetate (FAA) hydrolase